MQRERELQRREANYNRSSTRRPECVAREELPQPVDAGATMRVAMAEMKQNDGMMRKAVREMWRAFAM